VFIGMTAAFFTESSHGNRTRGQQSVLKTCEKYSEVQLFWHCIYVATETGLLCVCVCVRVRACYSVRLRMIDSQRETDQHRDEQIVL
jgi:hypothetical protein